MSELLNFDPEAIKSVPDPQALEAPLNRVPDDEPDEEAAPSAAGFIVQRALERHDLALSTDGLAVLIPHEQPRIARRARGGRHSLLDSLAVDYYEETGRMVTQNALVQVDGLLRGMAQRLEPTELHLRSAVHAGCVYIDLGSATGEVIEVKPGAWSIVDQAPVIFQRTTVTATLPMPTRTGDVLDLWNAVKVVEEDQPLLLAWILAAWLADRPCPILAFTGQQGAGKSTAARVLVQLTDPSPVPLRRPPTQEDRWPEVANGSRVLAFDNVSVIRDWLSDTLCRAVTGDGDVKRVLYTDAELAVYSFRRAIVLNGISWGDSRGDLAERLITCELRPLTQRYTEEDLQAAIGEMLPGVFGALLDLLAQVLTVLPRVQVDPLPRMADFARILAAVDEVMGTQGLARYRERLEQVARESAHNDPVLAAIAQSTAGGWRGTAAELAERISYARPEGAAGAAWPRTGSKMTGFLTRQAPVATKAGWTLAEDGMDRTKKVKAWLIEPPLATTES